MQFVLFHLFLCVILLSNFVISGAYFPANSDNITAQWMENYKETGNLPQVLSVFNCPNLTSIIRCVNLVKAPPPHLFGKPLLPPYQMAQFFRCL